MSISTKSVFRIFCGWILFFGCLMFFVLNTTPPSKAQTGTGTGGKRPPTEPTTSKPKQTAKSKVKTRRQTASQSVNPSKSEPAVTSPNKRPKLWITYASDTTKSGNFTFIEQKLRDEGVDVTFDKVALIPGLRLWEQIAEHIEDPKLDGWAILLTN